MFWPVLRFVVVVPALVAIALQQAEIWEEPDAVWKLGPFLAVALVGAVEPLVTGIRDRRGARRVAREVTVREMLGQGLAQIEGLTRIPCAKLGASAYCLGRKRFRGPQRLHRIARLRLAPQPASNVDWFVGKGVVGLCARREMDVTIDVFGLHEPYRAADEWAHLDSATTLGLSWQECELLRGKHGFIVATPVNDPASGRVIGVVTIDGPPLGSAALDTGSVCAVVRQLATVVARGIAR